MAKVRIQFTKGTAVKYLSHLDILRTFERALRRAGIKMLYSAGFHPKPKLAFASALAVGVTSEAEYVDLEVADGQSASWIGERLHEALPRGLDVVKSVAVPSSAPALMATVNAASYCLTVREPAAALPQRIQELLDRENVLVERQGKKGMRSLDVRPWIYALSIEDSCIRLEAASGSAGNLRVEEVIQLLGLNPTNVDVHRTGLWTRDGHTKLDLLAGGTA